MKSQEFRHNLGDKARDRISGLVGIITSRAEHLFGCARYWISPQEHKDGKVEGGGWFDEDSVEIVEAAAIKPQRYRVVDIDQPAYEPQSIRRAGGPSSQPTSQQRQTTK